MRSVEVGVLALAVLAGWLVCCVDRESHESSCGHLVQSVASLLDRDFDATVAPSQLTPLARLLTAGSGHCHDTLSSCQVSPSDTHRVCQYLTVLSGNLTPQKPSVSAVVVVGAGPAGLLSALLALEKGALVTVVEKRGARWADRETWFDLYKSVANVSSVDSALYKYGGEMIDIDAEHHAGGAVVSVRCDVLQHFLMKAFMLLKSPRDSVLMACSVLAITDCDTASGPACAKLECSDKTSPPVRLPVDILIGADGSDSTVRRSIMNIQKVFPTSVTPHGRRSTSNSHGTPGVTDGTPPSDGTAGTGGVPSLSVSSPPSHVTMLVEIEPTNGSCPSVKTYADGETVEPSYPAFFVRGVTGVFKRFYRGHCHLQLLFDRQHGEATFREWTETGNWTSAMNTLFEVVQITFDERLTYEELQKRIKKRDLLKLKIFSVEADTQLVSTAVVTLIGDAAASSYYRLGIGIHHIVQTLREISVLIEDLESGQSKTAGIHVKVQTGSARLRAHGAFQLAVLLHEAYCGHVVGFASWNADSLAIFKRDFTTWDAPLPVSKVEESATHSPLERLAAVQMCQDILDQLQSVSIQGMSNQ